MGIGKPFWWVVRQYLPALLILIVTALLSFSCIFVESMSSAIDSVLVLLGSGDVLVTEDFDRGLLSEGSIVFETESADAIAASDDKVVLLSLKGVDEDYFYAERAGRLKVKGVENTTGLKGIMLSEIEMAELGVHLGDKVSLMLYDGKRGRARPVILFVEGSYSSGYREFDASLAYTSKDVAESGVSYEIVTDEDANTLEARLRSEGYNAYSYRNLYPSLYDNLTLSVRLLSFIVVGIASLSGFFALSVSAECIERDRRDIAGLFVVGFSPDDIVKGYRLISFGLVAVSSVLGTAIGIASSYLLSPLLSSLDPVKHPALQNYILDFSVTVPPEKLALMVLALLFTSYASLLVALKRSIFSDLHGALVS